jgi:hypothetical protein
MNELTPEDVKARFESEFCSILGKFAVYDITLDTIKEYSAPFLWKPGVYVFWKASKGVIKVGRHLANSCKRALEHINDNTGNIMKELEDDPDTHLILFNVKLFKDRHWVAALEIFLELELKPEVPSGRLG